MVKLNCEVAVENFVKVNDLLLSKRHQSQLDLTSGMEVLDGILKLKFGQFVAFQGKPAHALSMLLCVRATLLQPLGPDCDSIFVDGGNLFDPYYISDRSVEHGLDTEKVLERLHISRAFTHHQLACLITDKLPPAIKKFRAKLVVVSDITQLYCDPDIQGDDKEDALRIFAKNAKTLASLARQQNCLIIATNLESRSALMEHILRQAAHVSTKIEEKGTLTHFSLLKHPWLTPRTAAASSPGVRTLESYM
jgi:RecA/RadA recombinase